VQVLADLEVFAVVVADDVRVPEGRQDLELGVELLALLLGHLQVADLLPAENHAVDLAADLSDDAERAMAWGRCVCQPMFAAEWAARDVKTESAYRSFPARRTCRFPTWWRQRWDAVGSGVQFETGCSISKR
jgi:hypothetical protein